MQVVRTYKNAAGDDLRYDIIVMERKGNTLASKAATHTFKRNLKTQVSHNSGVADRVVSEIELVGDFDEIDSSTYKWASWNSPIARVDMSDLPGLTDTV